MNIDHEAMRIAGEKVYTESSIEVRYPYTGEVVGTVPRGKVEHLRAAFQAAMDYKPGLTRYQRAEILRRAAQILAARRDEIARRITLEAGICLKDSSYEVGRACDVFNLAAQLCILDDGQSFACDVSPQGKARRIHTLREPLLGVISAITPFNHPLNQVAHKVAPSIATNNRMVLKPTEKTPLTALMLADVLYEAGLPPAMFSVVTGDPAEIADEMLTNEHVELITFTGGVPIGKYIASKAGYRRLVLELGGNDPLIVMEDADLDKAAELAVAGSYKNSGQRCTAVKRILVQRDIADDFAALVVEKTRKLKYGDPLDPSTDMGTVINERSALLFQRRVEDACAQGAKLLWGNERRGALYAPTVLDHVPYDCELVREETFGPVAPIIRFKDIDEAIGISNSTAYGLSSGVCSNRLDYITRFVRELRVGTVNVWEVPGYRIEMSPFGGIKDSGLGYKEGVLEAMKSFTNVKTYSLPWP
ncbi:MAG TPA: phosphonoacetaldehyde dehydrogenase [Candidatus Competibacteraceae bacterium]|nr:phosphonoacetaldehyde dehydrogenase [Candidatus Competibacteraceae bacterium]